MAQQVVTELVIDADTSGADRFASAMDRAGGSADKGSVSAQQMTLAIAGVGVAAAAALVGLRSFIDYVGNQTQALVDMADHARLAGISTREFQETLFAARAKGLTEKDFVSGLDKLTANLTAASRGATEFGRLFEANGLSIRRASGELKTGGDALGDLAKLMQNASPAVQQAMTRIVGLSASWVPFLRQGAEGIEAQKKAAADLGVIIDDNMIDKAREFNAQWKTAVATWDLQFKASLASILPLLIKMASLASTIIEGIGAVANTTSRLLTPDSEKSSSQLAEQINEAQRLIELMQKFGEMPERVGTLGSFRSMQVYNLKGALGLPEDADFKRVFGYLDELTKRYDELQKKRVILETSGGATVLPQAEATRNALDGEIDRIEKHIALLQADTEAVGQAEAARAGLRAEAALYAAAERSGFKDLEQFAERFHAIREAVETATAALAKARVGADIKFNQQTVGLSQEDVQIAQQLRGIYPDVADALGSIEAQMMRVTTVQKTLADGFREVGKEMFSAFLSGANVMDAMVRSLDNLAKKLANSAFDNILSGLMTGNLAQAGIGALQAGASALISAFTGDQKAKKELEEAQKRWAAMADQVTAFNRAAAGVDLGPLTSQLMQLQSTYKQLALAALEARDYQAIGNLQETFNRGVNRTVQSFLAASPVVDDLGRQLTAVADEGSGLIEFLQSLGPLMQRDIDTITAAIVRQQQELRASVEKGLVADIRNNSGVGYLNTISDAIEKFNTMVGQGVSSGVSSAWLYSTAQAAINGAKLQGQAYQDLIALYPQLTRVTHEFIDTEAAAAAAAEAAARAEAIATEKLGLQLRLLGATTDTSTLAGQLAIFDAKARQEYDAAVAAGTVAENLGLLTQALAAERDQIVRNSEAALASAAAQKAAADATEQANLQLRLLSATTDSSTLQGALTLFDAKAIRERADAVAAGSANIALLDQALAAERLNIVNDFGQKAADAEKQLADQRLGQIQRIQQYLDNLAGGTNSTLSPVDRLAASRQQFNAQFAAARAGDQNALSNITQYSDNFLAASRDFNASSQAYQNDRAYIITALSSLTGANTIGSASIPGVTPIASVSSVPANNNSFAGVVDAVRSLEGKVVSLQAALKESIDRNSAVVAQASEDEGEKLDLIAANTGRIPAAGNLALAMPG